ncbi:MAG: hypothetical protein CML89_02005, partial [Rhodobiaceae bacterium]|nr:hypothetical protein [Rhodobiaceae bacterium]
MYKIILCLIALISLSVNVKANNTSDISNNSLVNIEEITVISSRAPIPLSEVIGSVSVIKSDEIEKRIANNIVDLIENTIGVSAPRSDGYGRIFNEGFRIRGLGGKRVNVLIDGVRIPDSYVGYGRDVVDVDLVKKVEILKGPSSALYGSDGLAGAISYTTKDASDLASRGNPYYSATVSYDDSSDSTKVGLMSAFVGNNIEGLIQITRRDTNERKLHNNTEIEPNSMTGESNSVLAKIKFLLNENIDVTFVADVQEWKNDWDLTTETGFSFFPTPIQTSSALGLDDSTRHRYSIELGFTRENILFDEGRITAFTQKTDQDQITDKSKLIFEMGMRARPTPYAEFQNFQFNQEIYGFSSEFFKEIGNQSRIKHQIVYGFEYESIEVERPRYRYETNLITRQLNYNIGGHTYPDKTFPDTETVRQGVYFSDRIEITSKASVVIGARYDSYELKPSVDELFNRSNVARNALSYIDDSAVSGKLGFIYDINDSISVFAQYAEGFRSPDYESANISFTNYAFYYSVAPNPNLDSEESDGYEIGLRGNNILGSSRLNWSLVYYENDYEDFIDTQLTGRSPRGISIYQYVNLNDVTIDGFELEVQALINENYSLYVGYSNSDGEQNGEKLISINPDQTIIGLNWNSDTGRFNIRGFANITEGSIDGLAPVCGRSGCSNLVETPGRATFDLFFNANISDNIALNMAIRNITNEKFYDWASI